MQGLGDNDDLYISTYEGQTAQLYALLVNFHSWFIDSAEGLCAISHTSSII